MKYHKTILILTALLVSGAFASAQTADEIITRYIQAVGGREFLTGITSLYTENKIEIMGNETIQKTTLLNGKGYKAEMDIMGSPLVTCYTDKGGWTINPYTGGTEATEMPESQYNAGKDEIYICSPFLNYVEKGYKAELMGNEVVGSVDAVKVKLTAPDNTSSTFFFDPATWYILKNIQQEEMQGQTVENTIIFSDYRTADGYTLPYNIKINIGGMFDMTSTVIKVEINKPVDPAIFVKP